MSWLWVGTDAPHTLPDWAYDYLLTRLKVSDAAYLFAVEQVSFRKNVLLSLIRIFDQHLVPDGVSIDSFASLDAHPELILYEGYRERDTGKVQIMSMKRQGKYGPYLLVSL